jgi:formylglycine-generating enzyme required for sulfatase activity
MPKKEAESVDPQSVNIRLQPIAGIPPRVYVPLAYAVSILLILFVIFVLPGITRHGSLVRFQSVPESASVYVDGKRVGATPTEVFVRSGEREIRISRPHFADWEDTRHIRGRLFGSLFLARRAELRAELQIEDVESLAESGLADFAAWSRAGRATAQYQFPPVYSDLSRDLLAAGLDRDELAAYFRSLSRTGLLHVGSESVLSDFVEGTLRLSGAGGALSSGGLARTVELFIQAMNESELAGAMLLLDALPDPAADKIEQSSWFAALLEAESPSGLADSEQSFASTEPADRYATLGSWDLDVAEAPLTLAPGRFVPVRGGELSLTPFSNELSLSSFFLLDRELTQGDFAVFVADEMRWAPANRDALVEAEHADRSYLSDFNPEAHPNRPLRYVSAEAARAFAEWASGQLPDELSNYRLRLPTEWELEYAARLNGSLGVFRHGSAVPQDVSGRSRGDLGAYDLVGNLWEISSSWYRPHGRGFAEQARRSSFPGSEWSLFGGSLANAREDIGYATRGGIAPGASSPFAGFRLVLVREREE